MKKLLNIMIITVISATLIGMCGCSKKDDTVDADATSTLSSEKYQQAMALYTEGRLEEALEAFRQVDKQSSAHYTDTQMKINVLTEKLFEKYVNQADGHYNAGEYQLAISALETALTYRESRPVRELLEHYKSAEGHKSVASYTPEQKQQAIKEMQTYQEGEGVLKIALDNIYTREFAISNVPITVSDDTVFLRLWVNIINEGTKDTLVKPEYIKLYTSDDRDHAYHAQYSKHLDIPFNEILLPPNGRASGRLLFLIPLENSYRFEYNDGTNRVIKTVIPY
jgi:tetratricopeptide (TPR) repeat protein